MSLFGNDNGQTINQAFYKEALIRLRDKVKRNHCELYENGRWFLYHDNAPSHTAVSIQEFLSEKNIPVIPHSPYSPDLAPCDFFLFPKIKMKLKGRFDNIPTIHKNVKVELKKLTVEDFQHCF
uniref:Tc1-like transposase DDE domain-containing protein n=1 Tax=Crocodylus porosus TaxID=8502 RepID=A0A7M4F7P6_CROPO